MVFWRSLPFTNWKAQFSGIKVSMVLAEQQDDAHHNHQVGNTAADVEPQFLTPISTVHGNQFGSEGNDIGGGCSAIN